MLWKTHSNGLSTLTKNNANFLAFWNANSHVPLLELQNKKSVLTIETRMPYHSSKTPPDESSHAT